MTESNFYKKLSKFQEILSNQDWTPDGNNDKQGYRFVTHKKIKKNVSKAIIDAGLIWQISFEDIRPGEAIGSMKQHYLVTAKACIRDPDNPANCIEYQAFGEAADSGDKALSKAQTSGFKAILHNNFFIADIDAEGEEIIENNDSIKAESDSSFEANQQIIRERVAKKFPVDTPAPKPAAQEGFMTPTQKAVMDKIVNKARILSEVELMPFGSIAQIEMDYANVKTADEAQIFISTYTGVLRCQ